MKFRELLSPAYLSKESLEEISSLEQFSRDQNNILLADKGKERIEAMIPSTVKNVFSKGFTSVRENDMLFSCLPLFKEKMPPVLAVLDSEGKYKGVLARRWIVRSLIVPYKPSP